MKFDGIVFPGQGAQKVGMAKDFVEQSTEAADVFKVANEILPFDIYPICHEENDLLNQTNYTQPAILVAEIAMYESIKASYSLQPEVFAGHSLGEYAALVAAEVLPFEVALEMVVKRGELMHQAITGGGMTAIIMEQIPLDQLITSVHQFEVDMANDNSNQQVVISGMAENVDQAVEHLRQQFQDQPFKAVPLTVSSAFHSRWMKPAEEAFHEYASQFKSDINTKNLPQVASNYLGEFYAADSAQLISALAKQISGSVQWRRNMELMKSSTILELGPNRPLRGFFKSIGVDITSVINLKSAAKAFSS